MIARHRGLGPLALLVALVGCTVEGVEVATTFDPNGPSGAPPTTSEGDTEMSGSTGSETASPSTESDDTSSPPMTDSGSGSGSDGSTGSMPVDEQPEDGMYSECMDVTQCIGLTTCVMAGATGFCSGSCADPVADCDVSPSATATAPPLCVDNGAGLVVCALSCGGGQTCPGGMDCVALGATMVCA